MPVAEVNSRSGNRGVAFLVAVGLVYEVIAAACSSPQTAEINADKRSATLMKWVYIGMEQAAFFIVLAALVDRQHAKEILAGGALGGSIMFVCYHYANQSGLKNAHLGGTEDNGPADTGSY
ncbi:MAG TPA: hypothetical protein VGG50_11575 [Streptosporangiaceae bacterium]